MNNIKIYREKEHITQEALARECDISLRHMQNIEAGKNIPNVMLAIKIKKALHVTSIEDLFPDT
jgi:DNA-binding XRE family transcriptional regulator